MDKSVIISIKGKQSYENVEDETIELIVTNVWTVAAALWSYWKNNSWTLKARKADAYLANEKSKL